MINTKRLVGYLNSGVIPNSTALDEAIDAHNKKEQSLNVILDILKGDIPRGTEVEDASPVSMEKHDKRFHGGHFDNQSMTCKLREDMAKSDDADSLLEKHEKSMSNMSNSKADEYLRLMKKKCPNLDPEETLEQIANISDRKLQGDAFRWLMNGKVKLPEDMYKVENARKLADKAKKDPFSYETPQACINDLEGEFKRGTDSGIKPIDPDTVPELSDKKVFPHGVTTYQVQDDDKGQKAMREIINTHWGKNANPWCLLHGDGKGNLSDGGNGVYNAAEYWKRYSSLPKRVAFKNGELLAFMATDEQPEDPDDHYDEYSEWYDEHRANYPYKSSIPSYESWVLENYGDEYSEVEEKWWDRKDTEHVGIPYGNMQIPDDKYGRWADYEIRDGKLVKMPLYKKGDREDIGYKLWYSTSNIVGEERILIDKDNLFIERSPDGNVESIKIKPHQKSDDNGETRIFYRNDGSVSEIQHSEWVKGKDNRNIQLKAYAEVKNGDFEEVIGEDYGGGDNGVLYKGWLSKASDKMDHALRKASEYGKRFSMANSKKGF